MTGWIKDASLAQAYAFRPVVDEASVNAVSTSKGASARKAELSDQSETAMPGSLKEGPLSEPAIGTTVTKALAQSAPIDAQKVSELRAAIQSGAYRVDAPVLADAMIKSL